MWRIFINLSVHNAWSVEFCRAGSEVEKKYSVGRRFLASVQQILECEFCMFFSLEVRGSHFVSVLVRVVVSARFGCFGGLVFSTCETWLWFGSTTKPGLVCFCSPGILLENCLEVPLRHCGFGRSLHWHLARLGAAGCERICKSGRIMPFYPRAVVFLWSVLSPRLFVVY